MNSLIITHGADTDGIACAMLLKLIDPKATTIMCEIFEVDNIVKKHIEENIFSKYDNIYITDLGIKEETANLIEEDDELKNKIKLFDHHITNINLNNYSWIKVELEEENGKASATTIFYRYLVETYQNELLLSNKVIEFVELVRQIDTWEWAKNNNLEAKKIGDIFIFYGGYTFMSEFLKKLRDKEGKLFDEKEEFIFNLEQDHITSYINKKEKTLIIKQIDEYKVGVVFADIYKSHLGNVLSEKYKDVIDFIIIIDLSKAISYRAFKEDVDLSKFAERYGGGGHKKAAANSLPEGIRDKIFDMIYSIEK